MGGLDRREGEWLDLVADLLESPMVDWPHDRVTRQLVETFDAVAGCHYTRSGAAPPVLRQWPHDVFAGHPDELAELTADESRNPHPVLRFYLAIGHVVPCQVADVPGWFANRRERDRWYGLYRSWGAVPNQFVLPLQDDRGTNRTQLVGREDPFTEQEMVLVRRLHRLLGVLDGQLSAFGAWSRGVRPPAVDVAQSVHLTPRELAVLGLLGRGLTAAAIGRRLRIAERTVQKHLQRCYAKLGVSERLAAVLRAQTMGLLSGPDTQFPSYPDPVERAVMDAAPTTAPPPRE